MTSREDTTLYVERSKVREIVIGHNAATQAVLSKVDALPIFTASDFSGVAQRVRALDWQETFSDRGDGSHDHVGWEADSGFGPWYDISEYFGSDSLGWHVTYDSTPIADTDDPDQAKQLAQADFEKRALSALTSTDRCPEDK